MIEQRERAIQCRDGHTVTLQHPSHGIVFVAREEQLIVINTILGTMNPPSFRCADCRQNFGCIVVNPLTQEDVEHILKKYNDTNLKGRAIDMEVFETITLEEDVTQVPVIPLSDARQMS